MSSLLSLNGRFPKSTRRAPPSSPNTVIKTSFSVTILTNAAFAASPQPSPCSTRKRKFLKVSESVKQTHQELLETQGRERRQHHCAGTGGTRGLPLAHAYGQGGSSSFSWDRFELRWRRGWQFPPCCFSSLQSSSPLTA